MPSDKYCLECDEYQGSNLCPDCYRCTNCCQCYYSDDFDADELGVDPEEGLDYNAAT